MKVKRRMALESESERKGLCKPEKVNGCRVCRVRWHNQGQTTRQPGNGIKALILFHTKYMRSNCQYNRYQMQYNLVNILKRHFCWLDDLLKHCC